MKERRVVVTGFAGISPLGNSWATVREKLLSCTNAVHVMEGWKDITGLKTQVGCPAAPFDLPSERYNRKSLRSMGRVGFMAVRATEWALEDAGLINDPLVTSGDMGIAYGSSAGTPSAIADVSNLLLQRTTLGMNANTYVRMMSHTAPVNIGLFFHVHGRLIPTSSACTSGSQGIGFAYEAIRFGRQTAMIAGGSEELDSGIAQLLAGSNPDAIEDRETRLSLAFDYIRDHFKYLSMPHYEAGTDDWAQEAAEVFLRQGKGNCYCFAAAFMYCARRLGYQAYVVAGYESTPDNDHAWTMIEENGETRLYDVQLEYAYLYQFGKGEIDAYAMTDSGGSVYNGFRYYFP